MAPVPKITFFHPKLSPNIMSIKSPLTPFFSYLSFPSILLFCQWSRAHSMSQVPSRLRVLAWLLYLLWNTLFLDVYLFTPASLSGLCSNATFTVRPSHPPPGKIGCSFPTLFTPILLPCFLYFHSTYHHLTYYVFYFLTFPLPPLECKLHKGRCVVYFVSCYNPSTILST